MNQILRVALPTPLPILYDYLPEEGSLLAPRVGVRVRVPFQHRELIGVIWEIASSSDVPADKLKSVTATIDTEPVFDEKVYKLLNWARQYYHHPVGEIVITALPVALRKGQPAELGQRNKFPNAQAMTPEAKLQLNSEQAAVFARITDALDSFQAFLLQGVTGSGKTEIYLQVIEQVLAAKRQVLILVPEIGLTPQTVARFQARFTEPVVVFHSRMTEKQRLATWLWARSGKAKLVIGTRSAVFMPFTELGIIIIDESHDLSFKQQDGWRYSARDLAVKRASLENIPIILGSATPSLESLANVEKSRFQALYLTRRAADASVPTYHVLDIRNQRLQQGLSPKLIKMLRAHLERGNQVLIFLNRRGFAPSLVCHHCGWSAKCQRCDVNMTLHLSPRYLQCHHCSTTRRVCRTCEACGSDELTPLGLGTERLEQSLCETFSEYAVVRVDRDTTKRKGELDEKLLSIHSGQSQILLGTQMLAKGHHFPNVTLVAILEIDSGLYSGEFRACERLAQLIEQVAGRAGRAKKAGEVALQTHCPEHPMFQILLQQGYAAYAKNLLQERANANLPPYSYMALLRAEAADMTVANEFLQSAKSILTPQLNDIYCFGPIPAPMIKKADRYRAQLLLQTSNRHLLHQSLASLAIELPKYPKKSYLRWSLDVDPQELF